MKNTLEIAIWNTSNSTLSQDADVPNQRFYFITTQLIELQNDLSCFDFEFRLTFYKVVFLFINLAPLVVNFMSIKQRI
jgi:hypothetical protein